MTGKIMPLRERGTSTIQAMADAFLSSPRGRRILHIGGGDPGDVPGLGLTSGGFARFLVVESAKKKGWFPGWPGKQASGVGPG